jgi:aspartate racemase
VYNTATAAGAELLGIVGGLGPRASAEFLKTIYEFAPQGSEQQWPRVLMYSDPSFPDRTETLTAGYDDLLLSPLIDALQRLRDLGAARIVICCVTLHHLLPLLPVSLRVFIWSLLDVAFAQLLLSRKPHLLLCSSGTRQLKIFERHPQWPAAHDYLILPDDDDQQSIHELIYEIKRNQDIRRLIPVVAHMLRKYDVNSFVAGCTEIHLLAKEFRTTPGGIGEYSCIDPLTIIATELTKESLCNI